MTGIVYVVEGFPALSQTFVQNELRELRARGIEPRVFALYSPHGPDPTASDLPFVLLPSPTGSPRRFLLALGRAAAARPLGVARAFALALARPSRLQFHSLGKAIFLLDALGPGRPRRFHAHFARASASTAMLAAAAAGARFSFTAHANDILQAPFDVERKLRRADVVVTVCHYNERRIESAWPGLGNVVMIPCGVQVHDFRRARPYRRDPYTIVAVGRLVEKKGFDDLLRACALLRDRGTAFRCRIIGEGKERPQLEALHAELGLGDQVVLEGARVPEDIRAALEEASVFCLPNVVAESGDLDSQPVVVKEALAMEVPCVVTDEVGNPEMVDRSSGRLVPPREPAALADALAELATTPEDDLRAMGRAGRRRVEEQFSLAQLAAELAASWASVESPG